MKIPWKAKLVWLKGIRSPFLDPNLWRLDSSGNLIYFPHYGNRYSPYGWEIDHINPYGPTELWNLQPLQWYANVIKSNYVSPQLRALMSL